MSIQESTITDLLGAIDKVGESKVKEILNILQSRDKLVDEVVDLICRKLNFNKAFLHINRRKFGEWRRTDVFVAIVYILRKNEVPFQAIRDYFDYQKMRINELYDGYFKLSEQIPYQKKLKSIIDEVDKQSQDIFSKYLINININHVKDRENNHG